MFGVASIGYANNPGERERMIQLKAGAVIMNMADLALAICAKPLLAKESRSALGARMSIGDVITTVINFAALVFLGAQVMLARNALKETAKGQAQEWERQRRKSTLDALVATSRYRESLKAVLPWNDRDPEVVAEFLKTANGNHQKLGPLRAYLNHLEDLAVGVKRNIFDLETIDISEGSRIIDTVACYAPYIESIRRELDRPTTYSEIEGLAEMLRRLRLQSAGFGEDNKSEDLAIRSRLALESDIKRLWVGLGWRGKRSARTVPSGGQLESHDITQQT